MTQLFETIANTGTKTTHINTYFSRFFIDDNPVYYSYNLHCVFFNIAFKTIRNASLTTYYRCSIIAHPSWVNADHKVSVRLSSTTTSSHYSLRKYKTIIACPLESFHRRTGIFLHEELKAIETFSTKFIYF